MLIDSALHLKVDGVTLASLGRLFEGLPARYRSALSRADPESESGIETLVRLRLRSLGISVRTQVRHRGVGRVDLLVGDRLVIEVDGREHHDSREAFASDRERDLVLFRDGFDRLRLTYAHVMYRWPEIEGVIVEAVRRRRHRWRMSDRPVPAPSSAVPPSATQASATPSTAQFRKKSAQFRNSEKGATP
ncbi:endonuclease domain-containing protein [Subtercola boreus]|uniref:endonuclease domain-containing protein n=1 Tax=Subtercola boreus TaxID=120213 RepID=UPI0011C06017|nr:DUF559 domain-containing protein [Subtercola boreus]